MGGQAISAKWGNITRDHTNQHCIKFIFILLFFMVSISPHLFSPQQSKNNGNDAKINKMLNIVLINFKSYLRYFSESNMLTSYHPSMLWISKILRDPKEEKLQWYFR